MSNYLTDHRIIAVSRPDKRINLFIQGGTSSSFVLPKDITAIEEYAFHNISGLTEVVFTNKDVVVEVDDNSGIPANAKFIVPAKFLSDYQAKYPNRVVETRGLIWTVPYVGDSTLTAVYINQCVIQEPDLANSEVVIIPVEFTSESVLSVLKDTDVFGESFPHVGNNVYYGNKKMYLNDARTILALDYIEINNAASGKTMSLGFSLPYTEGKTFTINTKFTLSSAMSSSGWFKGRFIGAVASQRAFSPIMLSTGTYGSTINMGCALANQGDRNPDYNYLSIPNSERDIYYEISASLTYSSTNPSQVFVINGETKTYAVAYSTDYRYAYGRTLNLAEDAYRGKVQYIEVLDDGSQTVNLVAAYDKSQDLYGLYETIGKTFRGNATYSGGLESQINN